MAAAAEKIATDDQSGQALAEDFGLEYLKASAVSVDPRALSLLEREDCKQLRAIPLGIGSDGALVAVSSPSEERFAAIRELTGGQTHFALISEGTLDALLSSRMFGESRARQGSEAPRKHEGTAKQPEVEVGEVKEADPPTDPAAATRREQREDNDGERPLAPEESIAPANQEPPTRDDREPPEPAAETSAPASETVVEDIVGAVLSALKNHVGSSPEVGPATPSETAPLPRSTEEVLSHLDATVESWSAVRTALAGIHAEFENTKKALRDAKEQLSVAHADNDQYRKQIRTLEGELAESRELVGQARTRLQEATELLEADPTQLRDSAELV